MNLELFILDGYGQFVWPAFIFTFLCCFILYLKTKNEFQKHEKMFLNQFKQTQFVKIKTVKNKETIKEVLSGSSIY